MLVKRLLAFLGIIFNLSQAKNYMCKCDVNMQFSRIIGGEEAIPNSHPWASALLRYNILFCGATIISQHFLLTAAHCIYSIDTREISIHIGSHDINKEVSVVRQIEKVFWHENFDVVTFDNDIGLVNINTPLLFGYKIKPAWLPKSKDYNYSGQEGLVTGWGRLGEHKKTSSVLRQVRVPIWSKKQCSQSGYDTGRISSNMMCAGFKNGFFDACQGDSGGPLLQINAAPYPKIIGIISWGRGCGRPNFPGIYTIVAKYINWIQKRADCLCQV